MHLTFVPHRSTPPGDPDFKVWASVDHAAAFGTSATLNIWFGVGEPADRFAIPEGEAARADELWRTTCFEVFLKEEGQDQYQEWNFSPSGRWAAYDFESYREGMRNAEVNEPYIRMEDNLTWWTLGATIAIPAGPRWLLGLSAVLEEKDGNKSYWALAHPEGEKPDFHHPDCFVAKLA